MHTPNTHNDINKLQGISVGSTTVSKYLIRRLLELGVTDIFGIPGDYVLGFMKQVEQSPIRLVGTTNELCAGYAADAYARLRGLGVACFTYAVGTLSAANAIAGAFAEKSPMVVISGAPGLRELRKRGMLHHMVGPADTQLRTLQPITAAQCVLDDPLTALREIDRVLAVCLRRKQPVYIEIPRDRVDMECPELPIQQVSYPTSDPDELREAVGEAMAMLHTASKPIILAGIEIHRMGLVPLLTSFAEKHHIPVCSTLLSKSVISEKHPLYAGTYVGALSRQDVVEFVEESDCVLSLGAMPTDTDTGIFTTHLAPSSTIYAIAEGIRICHHSFGDVLLDEFLTQLSAQELPVYSRKVPSLKNPLAAPWKADQNKEMTTERLFQKINSILVPDMAVLADPGDARFGSIDLAVHQGAKFLASSFYATLGWAVPAAIGAQIALPGLRPLVLVGDGAFHFTGTELSTAVRMGLDPIVIVLNNHGYLTERFILEGKFNDVQEWQFHKLPALFDSGEGFLVRTEGQLDDALTKALANKGKFSILNVMLDKMDSSPALRRLGESLANRVG